MFLTLLFIFASVQLVVLEEYIIPENINIDEILDSDRLLQNYVKCVVGKGKCTPDGEKLKKAIPEALKNGCEKCNDQVRETIRKVLRHLTEKRKDLWKELQDKFDPDGKYKNKYKDLIEKENIKV